MSHAHVPEPDPDEHPGVPGGRAAFRRLLVTQAQVAFNDNAAKLVMTGLGVLVLQRAGNAEAAATLPNVVAALLVLPFILFSPLAGWLADRFSKTVVIHASLAFQLVVMEMLLVAAWIDHLPLALVGFACLCLQSTLMSPAKQGIVKELVGSRHLPAATGWLELWTILAILAGTFVGGQLFDRATVRLGDDPWAGALASAAVLTVLAGFGWLLWVGSPRLPAATGTPFHPRILVGHFGQLGELVRHRELGWSALGVAWFFGLGGFVFLVLAQSGRELHAGDTGTASSTGLWMLLTGLGIAGGSALAARLQRRRLELGLVPMGAMALVATFAGLALRGPGGWAGGTLLVLTGVAAAIFLVPCAAFLQDRSPDDRRGRVLAAGNLLNNVAGLVAVGVQWFLGAHLGLSPEAQFGLAAAISVGVAVLAWALLVPEGVALVLRALARAVYRVDIRGIEHLPRKGGVLVLPNHVSYADIVILGAISPRPLRAVGAVELTRAWWMALAFRIFGVIPIDTAPSKAKSALKRIADALAAGEAVVIFPEGAITRSGMLGTIRRGAEIAARSAGVPVVPVALDSLYGSIFSYSEGRFFRKWPRAIPYPVTILFGSPMNPDQVNPEQLRQTLLDLGEQAFQDRPELKGHLGAACVRALRKRPGHELIVDRTLGRKALTCSKILGVGLALASRWKAIPETRVGVVLPPGAGGLLANLALVLAGKVPVNLNFTAGRAANESCIRRAGIRTLITANALKQKFDQFPWPEDTRDITAELGALGKPAILARILVSRVLPASWTIALFGVPTTGDRAEAALLFSSGSTGEPKGVVLTHRNILGNCRQVADCGLLPETETILGALPIFHSFGFTVQLWFSLLHGIRIVTLPSPLETRRVAETIRDERCTILIGTPTFFRPYFKKVEPELLKSLKFVVGGAEKTPEGFAEQWEQTFGCPYLEGYGLTETTPVCAVNLPHLDPSRPRSEFSRIGSVGRMMPGHAARIADPDTLQPIEITRTGLLLLKGPNVFPGYLNDPDRTRAVFTEDGWFITGDLARFDQDGFLHIEGRLSRFSKLGGEMVPHGTVEQAIVEAFGWEQAEQAMAAVTGIADAQKGESLVVITTADIEVDELRRRLAEKGLPNLWIPRRILKVEKIPCLASGKLDLRALQDLAARATGG